LTPRKEQPATKKEEGEILVKALGGAKRKSSRKGKAKGKAEEKEPPLSDWEGGGSVEGEGTGLNLREGGGMGKGGGPFATMEAAQHRTAKKGMPKLFSNKGDGARG